MSSEHSINSSTDIPSNMPDGSGEQIVVESRGEERDALGNVNDPTAMASINGEEETVSAAPPQSLPPQEEPQTTESVMQADAEDSRSEDDDQNDAVIEMSHDPESGAPTESDGQNEVLEVGSHGSPDEGQNLPEEDLEEDATTVDSHQETADNQNHEGLGASVSADSDSIDQKKTGAQGSQTTETGIEGVSASEEDEGHSGDKVDKKDGGSMGSKKVAKEGPTMRKFLPLAIDLTNKAIRTWGGFKDYKTRARNDVIEEVAEKYGDDERFEDIRAVAVDYFDRHYPLQPGENRQTGKEGLDLEGPTMRKFLPLAIDLTNKAIRTWGGFKDYKTRARNDVIEEVAEKYGDDERFEDIRAVAVDYFDRHYPLQPDQSSEAA